MKLRAIGDVHGKWSVYEKIITGTRETIQVGDMGVGFRHISGANAGKIMGQPPYFPMVDGNHRFIRGNHDNPEECAKHPQWIKDGTIESDIMFVGGAVSIDRAYRSPGFSWWPDEELSQDELEALITKYVDAKPRVMITHDCPEQVAEQVLNSIVRLGAPSSGYTKLDPQHASRSRLAFDRMWSAHPPELWVFGHWHQPFDHVLKGTRFVCLGELEVKDFEL